MKKFFCAAVAAALAASALFAFPACGTAEVVYTLSEDGEYYVVSGVSGSKSALTSYQTPLTYEDPETGISLPVKEIGTDAFMGCTSLYNVTLTQNITKIGMRAFMLCNFTEFTIPDSVTEISYGAFGMCRSLREITVPESVTTLGMRAFYGCTSLERAYVRANITELPYQSFYNSVGEGGYTLTSLTEVYLSASVQKIYIAALYGNFITDIYYAGGQEEWDNLVFVSVALNEETDEVVETVEDKIETLGSIVVHLNAEF